MLARYAVGVLLAAFLVLFAAAVLLATPAQAQTERTLVSNTGQASESYAYIAVNDITSGQAQGFRTGPSASGYNITSVRIHIGAIIGSQVAASDFTAYVYTKGADNRPHTLVHTLITPTLDAIGVMTFAAPTGATLAGGTAYMLAFRGTSDDNNDLAIRGTGSNLEDDASLPGWTIEDARRLDGSFNGTHSLQFRVVGSIINSAASGKPTISGTAEVNETLTADSSGITDDDGKTEADADNADHAYSYQWIRVDGTDEEDITGATDSTYTLTTADVGKRVKVEVSFTDDAGSTEGPLTSDAFPATGHITAPVSDDATLKQPGLTGRTFLSGSIFSSVEAELSPTFDPDILSYTASLETEYIHLAPVPNDSFGSIAITFRDRVIRDEPVQVISTEPGVYDFTVTVTASDGVSTRTYRFTVIRPEAEAKLESLTVTPVTGSLLWFKPAFRRGHRGPYTAWVTHDATEVTVDVVATRNSARVEMPDDVNTGEPGTQIEVPADERRARLVSVFNLPYGERCRGEYLSLCYSYWLVVKRPGSALTGRLRKRPSVTDGGSLRYRFRVKLSAPVELSLSDWTSNVFTVANGAITDAKRVGGNRAGPGGDPLSLTWDLTVNPTNEANNTVVSYTTKSTCTATGAVCTVGGLKLGSLNSLTFGQSDRVPKVSIADTSGDEDDGQIVFTVSLTRASQHHVFVDFETIDSGSGAGDATPESDYWPQFTRLFIPRGSTSVKAGVGLIDDSVNDDGETVKVRLSNARVVGNGGRELYPLAITTATATGTISNSDPMPKAWIGRFGRTVAEQVLEAVEARMRAPRVPGTELSLAGRQVGGAVVPDGTVPMDDGAQPGAERSLVAWFGDANDADRRWGLQGQTMTQRDFLLGSSFSFTGGTERTGTYALWGRGAVMSFDGREGGLSLDGEASSGMLGADWSRDALMTGLVVSHSLGEGSYRGKSGDGGITSSLTGLYPWGRYALRDRVSVWGMAGYGEGTLTLTPEGAAPIRTDLDLTMAAAGLRGVLVRAPETGGLELAVKTDAMGVQTSTAKARGLEAEEADVTRLRLGLEGSRPFRFAGGASLTPSVEIGARHDGGDAETGFGVYIGGGLAWSDAQRGLSAELRSRGLLTHDAAGFRERGLSGALSWDPTPETGRGLSLSISQAVGAQASGGVDALLERGTLAGLAANDAGEGDLAQRRFELKLGYGLAAFGDRFTWTPEAGFGQSNAGRDYGLGWRLVRDRRAGEIGWLELSFEARRQEGANDNAEPVHEIGLRVTARF